MATEPVNIDAERSVLGCVLLNPTAMYGIVDILGSNPDVFAADAHQAIYGAMLCLAFSERVPVDAVTLLSELHSRSQLEEVGGASYISDLTGIVPTSANWEHYANIVRDAYVRRATRDVCSDASRGDYQPHEVLDRLKALTQTQAATLIKASDAAPDVLARLEAIANGTADQGIPTGYTSLDTLLRGGLQHQEYVILAARPSHGKTSLGLNILHHAVTHGIPTLFFSVEMGRQSVMERMFGIHSGCQVTRLREGVQSHDDLALAKHAAAATASWPLWLDDTASIDVYKLSARARRWNEMHAHGNGLIAVDYVQLIAGDPTARSREQDVSAISRELKSIARETNCPVLALCQLSRQAESETDHFKKLATLRESGSLEQDADVGIILARLSEDEVTTYAQEAIATRDDLEQSAIVCVAKNRQGPTGRTFLKFEKSTQRFTAIKPPASTWRPAIPQENDNDTPF